MVSLGFFKPIVSNEHAKLSAVEFFDGYFALSGKRYHLIKERDLNHKKTNYEVEEFYKKPSYLLNAAKIASYFTLIIPLIMLVGKAIARQNYKFFIQNPNAPSTKTIDFDEFRQKALNAFQAKKIHNKCVHFNFDEIQKQDLLLAYRHKDHPNIQGFKGKRAYGGVNVVCFLDSIPDLVFKPMGNKAEAEKYVAIVHKAQNLLINNDLYLLDTPETQVVEVSGKFFVAQEKLSLMNDDYRFIKGLYTHCWNDQELKPYMRELFSQLLIFICAMKFSDVKYDNIPLTTSGTIGLIDIDEQRVMTGLFHGGSIHHDGLFSYLPLEEMEEFAQKARGLLGENFDEALYTAAHQRLAKKREKNHLHLQFIEKNHRNPEIDLKVIKKFKWRDRKEAALVINEINRQLREQKNNLSLTEARRVQLDPTDMTSSNKSEIPRFKKWKERILPTLKNEGCLSRYRVDENYRFSVIHC
jgi:hypothetical protein